MDILSSRILLYILLPVIATIGGGIVAVSKEPQPLLKSAVQHFAAGVVFAAVAGELLPDAIHSRALLQVVGGFVLGVAVMFAMKYWSEHREHHAEAVANGSAALPIGLIVAVGVDALLDGLVIGIGFAVGTKQGILIAVALTLEMFFLGLVTTLALIAPQVSKLKVLLVIAGISLLIPIGAIIGFMLLSGVSETWLAGVLAFGCATLLYLVTEELLIQAHSVSETPIVTSVFFAGFLLLVVIEMMI